jgi:hypothetical protein
MEMNLMPLNERDLLWKERIEAFEVSDLNGAQWCRSQEIPVKQFRYWYKKLRRKAAPQTEETARNRWTAVSRETTVDAPLLLVCGSIKIEVRQPFNPELLQAVLKVLPQ